MRAYGYWADIIQAALMLPASMDAQLAEILGRNIQAALMLRVWGCAVCVVLCCRLAAVIRCTVGSSACVRVTDWSHVVSQALLSVQISENFSSALCAAYFVKYFGKSTSAPNHSSAIGLPHLIPPPRVPAQRPHPRPVNMSCFGTWLRRVAELGWRCLRSRY